MPILLLVRHATNDFVKTGRLPGQTPNIHLNAEGRAQAESLGLALKHRKLDAVYASQLERAIETAWRIALHHALPIHIRPGVADINNGRFTGKEIKVLSESEETRALWKTVVETPSLAVFPDGEGMLAMQTRVVGALWEIARAHPDLDVPPPDDAPADAAPTKRPQTVAVVMHADPIKAALAHFLAMPFDVFQRLMVSPASYSTLVLGLDPDSKPAVGNINVV
jgi:broad specificity phosphatase PhoE